jgi:hypothetical protein
MSGIMTFNSRSMLENTSTKGKYALTAPLSDKLPMHFQLVQAFDCATLAMLTEASRRLAVENETRAFTYIC